MKINLYLFRSFLDSFVAFFITLFSIMSIIFFLQIARITAYIEVNFIEIIKLYLFSMPNAIILSLPPAFFVALCMSLFKLSKENESIVLFALSYEPFKIAKLFLVIASIISIALLFLSLIVIPKASQLNTNFIDYKKLNAKLNLKASKFGQKFSDWLVFISSSQKDNNKKIYKDIIMFNPNHKVIIAKEALISNDHQNIKLNLKNGKIYDINPKFITLNKFENMDIFSNQTEEISKPSGVWQYWQKAKIDKKIRKNLSTYVLVSLFPISSVFFAIAFGIVNYRYEKGTIVYIGCFSVILMYFLAITIFSNNPILAIAITFPFSFIIGYIIYKKRIAKRY